MRRVSGLVVIAAVLSACAHPSATSGTGTAATPATAPADRNPCAVAGSCIVDIAISDDVVNQLQRAGMNFKIYPGCPRSLGFRDNSASGRVPFSVDNGVAPKSNPSMRGGIPVAQSSNTTVVIPRMSGRYATVGIFFGSDPGKYAVVDFGKGPSQGVKFGYIYNGRSVVDDNVVDGQNRTAERRICP